MTKEEGATLRAFCTRTAHAQIRNDHMQEMEKL